MFKNIGTKIKNFVTVMVVISSVIFVIFGIYLIFAEESSTGIRLFGLLVSVIGPILSWISGFVMYGFGELVEKIDLIEKYLRFKSNENEDELKKILDDQLDDEDVEDECTYSLYENESVEE